MVDGHALKGCPFETRITRERLLDRLRRMEDSMGTRLYVGNLPFDVCEADVRELFEGIGQVADCNMIVDKFTNKSRGFAFVEMASHEDATKAVAEFNGKDFKGRPLTVNEARPREERGGGGGGGRGDFGGGRGRR